MKVTLDTNVLLSATLWTGSSARIFDFIQQGEIELVLSDEIIDEYANVMYYDEIQDKIKKHNLELMIVIEDLVAFSTIVNPTRKINVVLEDPTDDKFLECAVEGESDYIITKDKHLLKLKEFEGIKIITPDAFLKIFYN